MPTLKIENAELFYTDSGGDNPAVVFSHGFGMDRTMFDAQVAALSPHYRVVTWDQRSWGSSIAKGPYNLWDSARDLWMILDQLDIERTVLVGMSQGGFVSIHFQKNCRARDRFAPQVGRARSGPCDGEAGSSRPR